MSLYTVPGGKNCALLVLLCLFGQLPASGTVRSSYPTNICGIELILPDQFLTLPSILVALLHQIFIWRLEITKSTLYSVLDASHTQSDIPTTYQIEILILQKRK